MEKDVCTDCNSTKIELDTNTHDMVCAMCGLVQDAYTIDPGPDWRDYGDGDVGGERTGMPSTHLLHDKGLTTDIDWLGEILIKQCKVVFPHITFLVKQPPKGAVFPIIVAKIDYTLDDALL